jgi:tetratricopeptide (TPR) repeat protein
VWGTSPARALGPVRATNTAHRKSLLASEHCYRTVEHSTQTWVFWVHAGTTAQLEQSFRDIAEQAQVRGRKDPQADVFKLVHDWLRNGKNGPWLLVLDNADDAAVLSPRLRASEEPSTEYHDGLGVLKQPLSSYLPPSRHGSVLVTSRTRRAATQVVDDSEIIPVKPMHGADACALLRKKLGDTLDQDTDEGVAELATALDHMPLALVQAATYIRERAPRCSVQQYLKEYQQSDSRKTSLLDEAASHSILIAWQISFDYIRRERPSAANLLSLMCFFDRQGIHEALLHSGGSAPPDGFEEDVLALRDYSFITVTRDAHTFQMHNLVQLAMRNWLENQGRIDKWRNQFIYRLCAALPEEEYKWEKCQALFPHIRAALACRPRDKESLKVWAFLLFRAARCAWQHERADVAELLATASMEARKKVFGEASVETLDSMGLLGLALIHEAKYKEAELVNLQTLVMREQVLGPNDPATLTSMNNVAGVLEKLGKFQEAETMSRRVLAQRLQVLGPDHIDTLKNQCNLAFVLDKQGKYDEAELMNRQTLVQQERVLGPGHADTLKSMGNLAIALDRQGKHEEAESRNRDALARTEQVFGHEHPHSMICRSNLVIVLTRQGKFEEAESIGRETLAWREKVFGPEHPETLTSMSILAVALDEQGKEEGELMHRETLARREKVLGPAHPATLASMNHVAGVLDRQGKFEEAELMQRETLAGREKVLGPKHPETLMTMCNLALVLNRMGKYEDARAWYEEALERAEDANGPEHPDTLMRVHYFALFLAEHHRYEESFALYERACTGFDAVLGKNHPRTRMCHEHYIEDKANAANKQRASPFPPETPDSSEDVRESMASRLAQGLARMGFRSRASSTRQKTST